MRDLMVEYRITARSIPEVIEGMERALSRYGASRRILFRGRKLSNEAFINAAILHLTGLPAEEQEKALSAAVARLESLLARDDPDSDGGFAPADPPPGPIRVESYPPPPAERKRRKGPA